MRAWMARVIVFVAAVAGAATVGAGQAAPQQAPAPAPGRSASLPPDANGNPRRLVGRTGHVSNYDESKIPPYTLPDPLLLANGRKVTTPSAWAGQRRPEIIKLYESFIFGRVPATAPTIAWRVTDVDRRAHGGTAVVKHVLGSVGTPARGVRIHVTVTTPASASGRVPLILIMNFGGGADLNAAARSLPVGDPPVAADILERGWGFATVGYQDIQPDVADSLTEGVIGLALKSARTQPASDEWGAISAWAWGASRIIDYLQTDPAVDGRRIALQGFSRLGKSMLWASALDTRIVAVFAACAGEMGSALSKRDYGETVDDMAQNFPWWFSGTYQQWPGRWEQMPVDAHMLIALSAPRRVFLTGGTGDQWADPNGEFLAARAATPVYQLLGKSGLPAADMPPLDTASIDGDIGWYYHTGPHAVPEADWRAFLNFLLKRF
ncbi:MAG: acetylxylan esterase [Acidobacteriota bacterium]